MSAEQYQHALETLGPLLSQYQHKTCSTETGVSEDYVEKMICDPWWFSIRETVCGECGGVPTNEILVRGGSTLRETIAQMRQDTPTSFKLVRFLAIPGGCALIGLLVGLIVMLVSEQPAWIVVGALGGVWLGVTIAKYICLAIRRAGLLWE